MKNRRRLSVHQRPQDELDERPDVTPPDAKPAADEWQPHWSVRLLLVLFIAGLPLLAAHLFFVPFYQTNDDIGNDAALRGILVSETPSHLTHCHPWFGRFVQFAYHWFPDWPCYRILCVAIQFVGSIGLMSTLLRSGVSWWRLAFCAAYASIFDFPAYVWPQFTVTAGETAAAGLVVCLFASRVENGRALWWLSGLGILFAAGCVRTEGLRMVILLFGPAIAVGTLTDLVIWWRRRTEFPWRRLAGDWGAVVAAGLLFIALEIGASLDKPQTAEYKDFQRFQRARYQILDFGRVPDGEKLDQVLREAGLSRNDLGMFLIWCICDETVYTPERLEAIVAASPPVRPEYSIMAREAARRLVNDSQAQALPLLLLCILLLCRRSPRDFLSAVTITLTMILLCLLLASAFHLPPRVRTALLAGMVAFSFQLDLRWGTSTTPRPLTTFMVALMFLEAFLAARVPRIYAASLRERARHSANALGLMEKVVAIPDAKVIVVGAQFPFELIPAGADLRKVKSWPVIWLGSDGVHGPGVKSRMKKLHVEHVMKQLATDENTFLFVTEDLFPIFDQWVLEHFGLHRRCEARGFLHQDDAGIPVCVSQMVPVEEDESTQKDK